MNSENNWALLYTYEQEKPKTFCELRIVGRELWIRSGNALTWGEKIVTVCSNAEKTLEIFCETIQEKLGEGWSLSRQGIYQPDEFNFAQLTHEIREGARQAFTEIQQKHSNNTLCGFALFSDEDAMTLGLAGVSQEFLQQQEDDPEYYLWNVPEWPLNDGEAYLDIAYRMILPRHQGIKSGISFTKFKKGLFKACITALEQLDQEGFFGSVAERENLVLLFQVTDSDDLFDDAVKKLNTEKNYKRWQAWLELCQLN